MRVYDKSIEMNEKSARVAGPIGRHDRELLDQYMEAFPPEMMSAFGFDDIASPAGYAQGTIFNLLGLILILIAGMTRGTRAIAGDEQTG